MDTLRKLLILIVAIVLVVVLGPVALRFAWPSWGFNADIESGKVHWKPVYGVLVERELGDALWEQYITGWVGPGTIQVVQYVAGGDDDLLPDSGGRQRVGTDELRVTLDLARVYSIGRSPDEFPIVIRQKYESGGDGFSAKGGKEIIAPYGTVYFGEYAALELQQPYRWGMKSLKAGDRLYLSHGRWSSVDQGDLQFVESLPEGTYAGFTLLRGVKLDRGMLLPDRIEALKALLGQESGGADGFPELSDGTSMQFQREPSDVALSAGIRRQLFSGDWTFPPTKEASLRARLPEATLDSGGGLPGTIAVGYGYSLPKELMPAADSMWFLRCLEQTEIAVPYSSPL